MGRSKGQGTIVPIGASPGGRKRWRVAVTMADGRRVWRTAHSPREAERIRAQLVEARELDLDPTRQTLAEYLRAWIARERGARVQRIRPTTLDTYSTIIERHIIPELGALKLSAVTARRIQAWIDDDDASPRTVLHHHAVLRRALNIAVRQRLLAYNPASAVELPDARRERADPLSLDEARALIEATAADWLGPLWRLAIVTGLRQGELLGLAWDDVMPGAIEVRGQLTRRVDDAERSAAAAEGRKPRGSWSTTKPKAARKVQRVAIDPATEAILEAHRLRMADARTADWRYHGLVFPTPRGEPWHGRDVLDAFHEACDRAELEHHPDAQGEHTGKCKIGIRRRRMHDLRHTSAHLLADAGVTEDVRMGRLGHSTTAMSRHYAGASETRDRDAAERLGRAIAG
jgi:integrase